MWPKTFNSKLTACAYLTLTLPAVTVSGAAPRVRWLSRKRRRSINCDSGNTWPESGLDWRGVACAVVLTSRSGGSGRPVWRWQQQSGARQKGIQGKQNVRLIGAMEAVYEGRVRGKDKKYVKEGADSVVT